MEQRRYKPRDASLGHTQRLSTFAPGEKVDIYTHQRQKDADELHKGGRRSLHPTYIGATVVQHVESARQPQNVSVAVKIGETTYHLGSGTAAVRSQASHPGNGHIPRR